MIVTYDRSVGAVAIYTVDSQGVMTLLQQHDGLGTTWDLAVTGGWAGPGDSGLLLYDQSAGVGSFYALDSTGGMVPLPQYSLGSGWDMALTGGWAGPGNSGLLLYSSTTQTAAFFAVDSSGPPTPLQQYQGQQWDLAVTGGWSGPGNSGLLVYNRAAGTGTFYGITSNGEMGPPHEYPLGTTWDLAVTGDWAYLGGRTALGEGLFLYDRAAGTGALYTVDFGTGITALTHQYDQWLDGSDLAVTGGWAGPGNSGLLLYNQSANICAIYAVNELGNVTPLQDDNPTGSWDLAVRAGLTSPANIGLLLYDKAAGTADFYAVDGQGVTSILQQYDWGASWDIAVTGGWAAPGDSGLLLYDRTAGTGAPVSVDGTGGMTPLPEQNLGAAWDLAVTGDWGDGWNTGLLLYQRDIGTGAFFAIDGTGVPTPLRQYPEMISPVGSWDLAVTGGWAGPGNSGLLLYERTAQIAAFYAIDRTGGMTPLQDQIVGTTWDLAVTGGWAGPGNSGLLGYDRAAGTVTVYAITSGGGMTTLQEHSVGTAWDLAVTGGWAGPGNSGLLLYDRSAGVAAFYAIDGTGGMTPLQQYDDWRTSWTIVAGQPATVPAQGLEGSTNYWLYSNCDPLVDLSVTVEVSQDIVCVEAENPGGPPFLGFSFQLNCSSPAGYTTAEEQYVIELAGNQLTGGIEFSPNTTDQFLYEFDLPTVPHSNVAPAGYKFKMALLNDARLWRTTWVLAVTGGWAGPGDSGLLLYDRYAQGGTAAFYHVDQHGGMKDMLRQYEDQPGWDLVVTGGWAGPGDSGLLIYNRFLGLAALYAITSDGGMTPLPGKTVGNTWDLAVTGGWAGPGNSGLLLYDQTAGVAAFYAVHSNGEMTLLRQYDDWRTSWDLVVTGGWASPGNSGLLLYDQSAGVAAFYAIDSNGDLNLLQQYDNCVTGVTFTVTDNHGHTVVNTTKNLLSLPNLQPGMDAPAQMTAGFLAPITAFQLNIVGPGNGETVVLSSGAGSIEYASPSLLTSTLWPPQCAQSAGGLTAEQANTEYGSLPAIASGVPKQSFISTPT
jgi:hypothetical protein